MENKIVRTLYTVLSLNLSIAILLLASPLTINAGWFNFWSSSKQVEPVQTRDQRWQKAISNPAPIIEYPLEIIEKDLERAAIGATGITLMASATSFTALKLTDIITNSQANNSDLAKIALITGGAIGIAYGYNRLKRRYKDYQESTPAGRVQWGQGMLSENNKTQVMSVYTPSWNSRDKEFADSFICTSNTVALKGICERSGLVWATLNQITSKSNKSNIDVEKLKDTAAHDFSLADSLLDAPRTARRRYPKLYTRIFLPNTIQDVALRNAMNNHDATHDSKELTESITHQDVKNYYKAAK